MPTAQSDAAVLALLEAITDPIALTEGQNLFYGPMMIPSANVPGFVVCVVATGGDMNQRCLGSPGVDVRRSSVQVLVRCDFADYTRGQALARACHAALHCPTIPSGWTDVQVPNQPEPFYLGMEPEGRHVWSLNVSLLRST